MAVTFEYDGETFPYVTDPNTLPLDFVDEIEQHFGGRDLNVILAEATTLRRVRILLWASIAARRPGFTLTEAGKLNLGDLEDVVATTMAPAPVVAPPEPEGVVLSPTSAGKRGTRKPASPKPRASAAPTARRSRASTASARGKSVS